MPAAVRGSIRFIGPAASWRARWSFPSFISSASTTAKPINSRTMPYARVPSECEFPARFRGNFPCAYRLTWPDLFEASITVTLLARRTSSLVDEISALQRTRYKLYSSQIRIDFGEDPGDLCESFAFGAGKLDDLRSVR